MDLQNDSRELNSAYRLLALCARAEGHAVFYAELSSQLRAFTAWDELPILAELHGMSALLWYHIHQAGIKIPADTERTLKGLYLRTRSYNQIHVRVLTELICLLNAGGIQPLVLKGLALAYQYYPDPALRPVSDIDLLFKKEEIPRALDLLATAGFKTAAHHASQTLGLIPKELKVSSPLQDGISIQIELHHYDPAHRTPKGNQHDDEFIGFGVKSYPLQIEQCVIYTPSPMDTLNYLSRHLQRHLFEATESNPLKLKWIADIVSLVEYHVKTFDWNNLLQLDSTLLQRLKVFYSLTPIPQSCRKLLSIKQTDPPDGINQYPNGWPQQRIEKWKSVGLFHFLMRTFKAPSIWWLRLYYGIDARSCFWHGQVTHRLHVLKLLFSVYKQKTRLGSRGN